MALIASAFPPGTAVADDVVEVEAVAETEPAVAPGDSVDDMAIWVDADDPSRSVIIAADHAEDSVEVYDLATGDRIQRLVTGGANDVDLRDGFLLDGEAVPLVTVVGSGEMRLYRFDPDHRELIEVTKGGPVEDASSHGVCMYRSRSGAFYAFRVNRRGRIEQFELSDAGGGRVAARVVRSFDVEPRPLADGGNSAMEACVVDDETGALFVAEEEFAIWRYDADPAAPASTADRVAVDTLVEDGGHIVPQIEGLALVQDPHGDGFLVASDQGDHTFNVYRRLPPHEFVQKVAVVDGDLADGCDRSDGIEVTTADLGHRFPRGVFVCQDNKNTGPLAGNQNLKLVPLERVVPLADPPPERPPVVPDPPPAPAPAPEPPPAPPAPGPPPPEDEARSGYWMAGRDGAVYAFGDARHHGDGVGSTEGDATVDLEPTPSGDGYWRLVAGGAVSPHGDAPDLGDAAGRLDPGEEAVSLSATPSGTGYWLFTGRGRVLPFGDAEHLGDMAGVELNGPVLDSVATPSGWGYFLVAADGGIFAFGDAVFAGSMGGIPLNAPVRSLVPDLDREGYWLVASDGGVFAFDAPFRGSMGDQPLNAPVAGMVAHGGGYLMVGADGGVFNFSERPFHGSLGGQPPGHPVVAVASLP